MPPQQQRSPSDVLHAAREAYNARRHGAAVELCTTLIDPPGALAAEAHLLRGLARSRQNPPDPAAVEDISQAFALQTPPRAEWYVIKADMELSAGQPGKALASCDAGIAAFPGNRKLLETRARALLDRDETGPALALLAELARTGTDHETLYWLGLAQRRARQYVRAEQTLRRAVDLSADGSDYKRMALAELARTLDKMARFEEAFAAMQRHNALASGPFDMAIFRDGFRQTRRNWARERTAGLPRMAGAGGRCTFFAGLPRCGSTLLEHMLDRHPEAVGIGEDSAFDRLARRLDPFRVKTFSQVTDTRRVDANAIQEISAGYLTHVAERVGDGRMAVDKNLGRYHHLGPLALALPEARVIWARRHPLDQILSAYQQDFVDNLRYSDLTRIAQLYIECEQMMRFWQAETDLRFLEVVYEDVIADPETALRRVLAFLDLDWDRACLVFHQSQRVASTASREQVRQPLYRSSVGRWRHYRGHLEPARRLLEAAGIAVPD